MNLSVFGINHKTAPIDIRENYYLSETERELFLSDLKSMPEVVEAFVICTCNRTEVYLNTLDSLDSFILFLKRLIRSKKEAKGLVDQSFFYFFKNDEAVRHLFRVSASLDSLVVGEKQILGQVKTAIERARDRAMFLKPFNLLSNYALRTGKKAHSETQISFGGSSISWAALKKAEEVLGSLRNKNILLIGAGQMGELSVEQITKRGFDKLFLMNRTQSVAEKLAEEHGGEAVGFSDMKEVLSQIDLCICASGAPHYILEKQTVAKCMLSREDHPVVFIDISMPRNIDPQVAEVWNARLYEIDDLEAVVDDSMNIRRKAIEEVEAIIDRKVIEFYRRIQKSTPIIEPLKA